MFILLSGSSGAGKTTLGTAVTARVDRLAFHELGEFADRPWAGEPGWSFRRLPVERALTRAQEYEREGIDMILTEGVLGELLAAPSAIELEGIASCLVDCGDDERLRRLRLRDNGRVSDAHQLWDFLVWALWLRRHAADPQLFAGPIRGPDDGGWAWDRWTSWPPGDPRWSSFVLDTTGEAVERSADRLAAWIEAQRRLRDQGELPLSGAWWRDRPRDATRRA